MRLNLAQKINRRSVESKIEQKSSVSAFVFRKPTIKSTQITQATQIFANRICKVASLVIINP